MSAANRQVQHRPQRETSKAQELAEVRQENRLLKRTISRLQKEIRRLEEQRPEPEEPAPPVTEQEQESCGCGSTQIISFTTPGGVTIRACQVCKARL